MALDQTKRYTNLALKEQDLISAGIHVLVAYKMAPKK
jgi:ribulose-bisphosphate carboxylase large chain